MVIRAKRLKKSTRLDIHPDLFVAPRSRLKLSRARDRNLIFVETKEGRRKATFPIGWENERGIETYEKEIGFSENEIESLVKIKEASVVGRPLRVLDAGAGKYIFLSDLRRILGANAELEGLGIARPLTEKQLLELKEPELIKELNLEGPPSAKVIKANTALFHKFKERTESNNLRTHVGLAETHQFSKKFDLIFSVGMFGYSLNTEQAVKNTLNHLASNGEAFLVFRNRYNPMKPEFAAELKRLGFSIEPMKKGRQRTAYRFKRL